MNGTKRVPKTQRPPGLLRKSEPKIVTNWPPLYKEKLGRTKEIAAGVCGRLTPIEKMELGAIEEPGSGLILKAEELRSCTLDLIPETVSTAFAVHVTAVIGKLEALRDPPRTC